MIGSVGCAVFATLRENSKTVVTAGLALVGNVCVALGNYNRGSLLNGKQGLEESYRVLLQSLPEMRFIQPQIAALLKRTDALPSGEEIKSLLDRAQILCKQVYEASKQVPGN